MTRRLRIRITGHVQGVGYRLTSADLARSLGLTGFVCNEPDGSVLIEAEGENGALEVFASWSKKGPPGASVMGATEEELPVQGDRSFEITRAVH